MSSDLSPHKILAKTNHILTSVAVRVYHLQAMVDFYTEAFDIQFQPVNTGGFFSQLGTFNER